MDKKGNRVISFLDVVINNNSSDSPVTSIFRMKTYTGLLIIFFSFISFSYKLGLVKTLVDTAYKINNNWKGFHLDIRQLRIVLEKNLFPVYLVDSVINGVFIIPVVKSPTHLCLRTIHQLLILNRLASLCWGCHRNVARTVSRGKIYIWRFP